MTPATFETIMQGMARCDRIFGDYASTHEAMGVCLEEWDEFRDAIRGNDRYEVQAECIDLVVALLRLHDQLDASAALRMRSGME